MQQNGIRNLHRKRREAPLPHRTPPKKATRSPPAQPIDPHCPVPPPGGVPEPTSTAPHPRPMNPNPTNHRAGGGGAPRGGQCPQPLPSTRRGMGGGDGRTSFVVWEFDVATPSPTRPKIPRGWGMSTEQSAPCLSANPLLGGANTGAEPRPYRPGFVLLAGVRGGDPSTE